MSLRWVGSAVVIRICVTIIKLLFACITDVAQRVIDAANAIGVKTFLTALDIGAGNPRLALGFVAQIFNAVGMESDLEVNVFAAYINYTLRDSPYAKHLLPLNTQSNELYHRQYDGFILAELLRDYKESALDITALASGKIACPFVPGFLDLTRTVCRRFGR
jgi:hypothetical protein